jgi:AraC-like DNA-binding protein
MSGRFVQFRAHRDLGLEHIAATLAYHRFPVHAHDEFLIGLTLEGEEELVQSGRQLVSRPGEVRLVNAFELHEGGAGPSGGWRYEAIYVPEALLAEATGIKAPRFNEAVVTDPDLAAALRRLFETLRTSQEPLERQSRFIAFATGALRPHVGGERASSGDEPRAVRRVRDHLHANALTRVTLDQLAAEAGLSKFHLLRLFKARTGFTPWQYQAYLRVEEAKRLLRAGEPPSQVADACGFVDQSHFTRMFKAMLGMTPGVYAAAHRRIWGYRR